MASLSIEVGRGSGHGSNEPIGLVAELDRLDGPRAARESRKVFVSSKTGRIVDGLAPGLWQVRLVTPAGQIDMREVELANVGVVPVRFTIGARRAAKPAPPSPPPATARRRRGFAPSADGNGGMRTTRFLADAGAVRTQPDDQPPIVVASAVRPSADGAVELWRRIAAAAADGTLLDELRGAEASSTVVPEILGVDDETRWHLPQKQESRTYALAGTRLHCVPVPWHARGGASPVVITLNSRPGPQRTRVVVEDEGFAGLLAYLASGSVRSAVDLIEADDDLAAAVGRSAQDALYGKRASPLGACAAGYALLGSSVPGADEPWHPWIENLSEWFPWIPDGAVLLARLRLMNTRDDEDAASALTTLHDALGRGLPCYRRGFDWLLQAMLRFPDDPIVDAVRPSLNDVAARLDMREIFTTLVIGGGTQ